MVALGRRLLTVEQMNLMEHPDGLKIWAALDRGKEYIPATRSLMEEACQDFSFAIY